VGAWRRLRTVWQGRTRRRLGSLGVGQYRLVDDGSLDQLVGHVWLPAIDLVGLDERTLGYQRSLDDMDRLHREHHRQQCHDFDRHHRRLGLCRDHHRFRRPGRSGHERCLGLHFRGQRDQ